MERILIIVGDKLSPDKPWLWFGGHRKISTNGQANTVLDRPDKQIVQLCNQRLLPIGYLQKGSGFDPATNSYGVMDGEFHQIVPKK